MNKNGKYSGAKSSKSLSITLKNIVSKFLSAYANLLFESYRNSNFGVAVAVSIVYYLAALFLCAFFAHNEVVTLVAKLGAVYLTIMVAIAIFELIKSIASNGLRLDDNFRGTITSLIIVLVIIISNIGQSKHSLFLLSLMSILMSVYITIEILNFFLLKINTFKKYFVLLLLSPLLAYMILSIFIIMLGNNVLYSIGENFVNQYTLLAIILGIFMIMTSLAKIEYLGELKVALALIIALASTLSYSFFLTDVITDFTMEKLMLPSDINRVDIRNEIEKYLSWSLIPYLIGSVNAMFVLEYRQLMASKLKRYETNRSLETYSEYE